MALQITRELMNGATGEYHSIAEIVIKEDKIRVRLNLHVSQSAKGLGRSALDCTTIEMDHNKSETCGKNIYEFVYQEIKKSNMVDGVEQNEFATALDV